VGSIETIDTILTPQLIQLVGLCTPCTLSLANTFSFDLDHVLLTHSAIAHCMSCTLCSSVTFTDVDDRRSNHTPAWCLGHTMSEYMAIPSDFVVVTSRKHRIVS
jgi:hypothetical protein